MRDLGSYLADDVSQGLGLEHEVLQHAGCAGQQIPVHSRCVALESVSQITGAPSLLQDVLEIIPFPGERISELHRITGVDHSSKGLQANKKSDG